MKGRNRLPVALLGLGIFGFGAGAARGQGALPSPSASPIQLLARGETVEPFAAEGLDGTMNHISYPKGSSTVLLFFLSSCPTCHRMIPEWNRAYDRRPKGLQVVGVLMDREPPGFFMATPVSFPVVRSPGKALREAFKVARVPLTLRVGPGGKVADVAMGVIDPIRLGEFFRP